MRIGQLARKMGVDTQTIRFYEKEGLLPTPDRQKNGYRTYGKKHGEELAFILGCRLLNLSLSEIRQLQVCRKNPHQPCAAINTLLDDHIARVQSQLATLEALQQQLAVLRKQCDDDRAVAECGILAGIGEGPR